MSRPLLHLWGWPIALGLLTIVGLLSALLGDGWWDAVSALTLGTLVGVGLWFTLRRTARPHSCRK